MDESCAEPWPTRQCGPEGACNVSARECQCQGTLVKSLEFHVLAGGTLESAPCDASLDLIRNLHIVAIVIYAVGLLMQVSIIRTRKHFKRTAPTICGYLFFLVPSLARVLDRSQSLLFGSHLMYTAFCCMGISSFSVGCSVFLSKYVIYAVKSARQCAVRVDPASRSRIELCRKIMRAIGPFAFISLQSFSLAAVPGITAQTRYASFKAGFLFLGLLPAVYCVMATVVLTVIVNTFKAFLKENQTLTMPQRASNPSTGVHRDSGPVLRLWDVAMRCCRRGASAPIRVAPTSDADSHSAIECVAAQRGHPVKAQAKTQPACSGQQELTKIVELQLLRIMKVKTLTMLLCVFIALIGWSALVFDAILYEWKVIMPCFIAAWGVFLNVTTMLIYTTGTRWRRERAKRRRRGYHQGDGAVSAANSGVMSAQTVNRSRTASQGVTPGGAISLGARPLGH